MLWLFATYQHKRCRRHTSGVQAPFRTPALPLDDLLAGRPLFVGEAMCSARGVITFARVRTSLGRCNST